GGPPEGGHHTRHEVRLKADATYGVRRRTPRMAVCGVRLQPDRIQTAYVVSGFSRTESNTATMRAVVQRVSSASVQVGGRRVGAIGLGLLAFVGVERGDSDADADYIAAKIRDLRVFEE